MNYRNNETEQKEEIKKKIISIEMEDDENG